MKPRILPQALWTLHWLGFRARLRKLGRGCRTVRGGLGLLAALTIFGFWIASFFIQRSQLPPNPDAIRTYVPVGLLVMCMMNLTFSKTGEGIAFRPAEVEFLFPGPFRRRELLLHRIVGNSLVLFPAALMFSMFVFPYVSFWLAGFIGSYLALQFVTLFQIVVGLFSGSLRERLFSRARMGIALLIVVGLVASLIMALSAPLPETGWRIAQLRETWPARILLSPFAVFARTMGAAGIGALALWGLAASGVNLLLVGLVLWLDLDYREASLRTSQRIHQRLQNARSGRIHWVGGAVNVKRLRYIGLPWFRGAGPIASYQLTMALRSVKGLVPFMLVMLVSVGVPMFLVGRSTAGNLLLPLAAPVLMFLLIVFPQFLQFDFRSDIDRMDLLKTLPLHPVAVACGELLAPTIFLLVIELFFAGIGVLAGAVPIGICLAAVPFLPLASLIVFAVENLIWLLYPFRMAVGGSADIQAMVRQMLMMMLKMLCLITVFGVAAGVGAITSLVADSVAAGVVVAWCACAGLCCGLVPLVAWAFQRFDPAMDTPA